MVNTLTSGGIVGEGLRSWGKTFQPVRPESGRIVRLLVIVDVFLFLVMEGKEEISENLARKQLFFDTLKQYVKFLVDIFCF